MKVQKIVQVVSINLKNEVLINASEKFNLNAQHYLKVLEAKGLQNKDIQVITSFLKN